MASITCYGIEKKICVHVIKIFQNFYWKLETVLSIYSKLLKIGKVVNICKTIYGSTIPEHNNVVRRHHNLLRLDIFLLAYENIIRDRETIFMVRARKYTQFEPDEPRANQGQVARWYSGKRCQPINARCFVCTPPQTARQ